MTRFFKFLLVPSLALGLTSCASTMMNENDRTVHFEFGKSHLTAEAKGKLDRMVDVLKSDSSVGAVNIVGYADHIGSERANESLSKRRAHAVKKYLEKKGWNYTNVGATRWVGEAHSNAGCGDKASRSTIECLSPDRKVEVEFVAKLSEYCQHKYGRHCRQD